jgi:hypothetical protein
MRRENAKTYPVVIAAKAAIQYSRDANDRTEKPRRTGSPAFAGDDSFVCGHSARVIASEAKQSISPRQEKWIASRSLSSGAHSRHLFRRLLQRRRARQDYLDPRAAARLRIEVEPGREEQDYARLRRVTEITASHLWGAVQ